MRPKIFNTFSLITIGIFFSLNAAAHPSEITGPDILNSKSISVSAENKKGLVVVFLSAVCPCSNSHIAELNDLAKKYSDFSFVGVHSNVNEGKELATSYFKKSRLTFSVIQDNEAKIANTFKALKTPHAYIVLKEGATAYQGGVSSSRDIARADRKYLREALEDLSAGKSVRTPEGRTLGCMISRGEKHVW